VVGIVAVGEGLGRAGEEVQVICGVALGRDDRVIALRHEYNVVSAREHDLVQSPVFGVHALDGVAFGPVNLVKVDFFEVGFEQRAVRGEAVFVVFVRGVGTPVAGRGIDFDGDEAVTVEARVEEAINLPGGVCAAANLDGDLRWGDERRGMVFVGRARAVGHVKIVRVRFEGEVGAAREVKGVGHSAEDVGAAAHLGPLAAIGAHTAHTAEDHQRQFRIACAVLPAFLGPQPPRGEVQVFPPGPFWGDGHVL